MDRTAIHNRPVGRVPLTPEMISALYEQRGRTGIGVPALVKNHLDHSGRITAKQIHRWMLGIVKSACPDRYAHVLRAWEGLPDQDDGYILYSPEVRAVMESERNRTGVMAVHVFPIEADLPRGLTLNQVRNFYCGSLRRLRREHFERLLEGWKALPPSGTSLMVTLTPDTTASLKAHAARTGKGAYAILAGVLDKPAGLRGAVVAKWLRRETLRARKDYLDYVLQRYEKTPDEASPPRQTAITAELRREMHRTGTSARDVRNMLGLDENRKWQALSREDMLTVLEHLRRSGHKG